MLRERGAHDGDVKCSECELCDQTMRSFVLSCSGMQVAEFADHESRWILALIYELPSLIWDTVATSFLPASKPVSFVCISSLRVRDWDARNNEAA